MQPKNKRNLRKTLYSLLSFIVLAFAVVYQMTGVLDAAGVYVTGHLIDTQWSGLNDGYNSLEVTMTPQVGDGDYYYFSNTVYFKNCTGNECIAYGGLQTNGYDGTSWIGKMAIFSVWNATQSIAEPGGKAVSFGGEGVGQSVRIPYAWQTGVGYKFKIYLDTDGSSKLWGASITNTSTGAVSRIGRIYAPTGQGLIYGPVTFHERYGGPQTTCDSVPASQVHFSNMNANDSAVKSSSWSHYYVASYPGCSNIWHKDSGDGFTSAVGTAQSVDLPVTPAQKPATPPASPVPKPTQVPTLAPTSPTLTNTTKPSDNSTVTNTVSSAQSKAKIRAKKNLVIPLVLTGVGLLLAGSTMSYIRLKKRLRGPKPVRHYSADPDIRGD